MPRACTVCTHKNADAINEEMVAGQPLSGISRRYRGISEDALYRHRDHISAKLAKAHEAREEVAADSLLARLRQVNRETSEILSEAKQAQDHELALKAITRVEKQIELEARLLGELQDAPLHLHLHREWIVLRSAILVALEGHPEARIAICKALESHHADP